MVVRKRRKKNKQRGERTHGHGNTKNKRGAGSRGGVGKAGSHKHKYSKYYDSFGKSGTLKTDKNDNYTIDINMVLKSNDTLIANYSGSIDMEDRFNSFILDTDFFETKAAVSFKDGSFNYASTIQILSLIL